MRSTTRLLALLLAAAAACDAPTSEEGTPRVLVFSRTVGYRHASIEAGVEAIRAIGREAGFDVEATEDASVFTTDGLDGYAAVVFLSTTGDVLNEAEQRALTAFIRGGGGFVGVHAASDTEYDWPWYGRLVGGYFAGHPSNPNVREDEWYEFGELEPGLNVLVEIDESSYKLPEEDPAPGLRPTAWYHELDGGRAWYTALGHTPESFGEPAFLAHVRGGLSYAVGRPVRVNAAASS